MSRYTIGIVFKAYFVLCQFSNIWCDVFQGSIMRMVAKHCIHYCYILLLAYRYGHTIVITVNCMVLCDAFFAFHRKHSGVDVFTICTLLQMYSNTTHTYTGFYLLFNNQAKLKIKFLLLVC